MKIVQFKLLLVVEQVNFVKCHRTRDYLNKQTFTKARFRSLTVTHKVNVSSSEAETSL